jgi:DnaJ family protein A protein 2
MPWSRWHLSCAFLLLLMSVYSAVGEDYYEVLGLKFVDGPSDSDVKRAYHRMALQHHPDKVAKEDAERAQQEFIKIAAAYEILGDAAKRLQYDNMRSAHAAEQKQQQEKQEHQHRQETGSSFGGGSRGFYREEDPPPGEGWQQQSDDFLFHVDVSLEAVYTGAQAAFSTQVAIVCPTCAGSGRCRVHSPLLEGSAGGGSDLQAAHELAVTHEHHYHEGVCPRCGGLGRLPHDIHQSFYIPPGAHEGMKARIEGTANAQVLVFSTPHARFIRRDNVHLDHILVITSSEAQLGWSRDIVHLDGRTLRVSSGRPCADGDVLLVPGEGMPVFGSPWQKGDMFVNISVSMDNTALIAARSRILLLPPSSDACSMSGAHGLDLQFAPDALGSGILLQERRLRDSDASTALLLPGDNITVATHPLSHLLLMTGIDLLLRGRPASAITVHLSCIHTNGDAVTSLLQPAPQSPALELDTWRALHFASRDGIVCPAAARVSLQVSFPLALCLSTIMCSLFCVIVAFFRFRWLETDPSSCNMCIPLWTPCILALPALPPPALCGCLLTKRCCFGCETTAATASARHQRSRMRPCTTLLVIERLNFGLLPKALLGCNAASVSHS